MKIKILKEPMLEFGNGAHICPRTGIETLGVYDKRDELRRSELRIGIVGRGEGVDLLDEWLDKCKRGIVGKEETKFPNLFRGLVAWMNTMGSTPKFCPLPVHTNPAEVRNQQHIEDHGP